MRKKRYFAVTLAWANPQGFSGYTIIELVAMGRVGSEIWCSDELRAFAMDFLDTLDALDEARQKIRDQRKSLRVLHKQVARLKMEHAEGTAIDTDFNALAALAEEALCIAEDPRTWRKP